MVYPDRIGTFIKVKHKEVANLTTLKYRLNRKNSSGTHDTIHYETSANIVLRNDGTTVETVLTTHDQHVANRSNPHGVTYSQVGAAASSHQHAAGDITSGTLAYARIPNLAASKITSGTFNAARIPNLAASKITAGTLAGQVVANASATSNLTTAQVRNIRAQTSDPGAGSSLTTGQILLIYE